jgi:hypothetical protein
MAISPTASPVPALTRDQPYEFGPPPTGYDTDAVGDSDLWGEDGFTFGDLLDLVNPLQHIPVVSTIYRQLTGDEIAPAARLIGGGLLGGIPGVVWAMTSVAVESASGRDIGAHLVAGLFGREADGNPATASALSGTGPTDPAPAARVVASRDGQIVAPPAAPDAPADVAANGRVPGSASGADSGPRSGSERAERPQDPAARFTGLFAPLAPPASPALIAAMAEAEGADPQDPAAAATDTDADREAVMRLYETYRDRLARSQVTAMPLPAIDAGAMAADAKDSR